MTVHARRRALPGRAWSFTKAMFRKYLADRTFDLGAALSYYTMFSIVPLLVVIIGISGLVAGKEAVTGRIFIDLQGLVGPDTAKTLQDLVGNAYLSGKGAVATVIGVITLMIGATGIFRSLRTSLDLMWGLKVKPVNSVKRFLLSNLVSFSFVLGMGFLLVVSLVLNSLTMILGHGIERLVPGFSAFALQAVAFVLSFGLTGFVFACLFKFLPHARVAWRDVWPGALFTAALFGLGRYIIALYFSVKDPASTFGAAAGLISLLIWTFYSSQIFFLGAVFVEQWARAQGRPIKPAPNAVKVVVHEEVLPARQHR